MAEFFTADPHVKETALRLHVLTTRIRQATQFAQQESVLNGLARDIAEARSLAAALAEHYPAEPTETNVRRLSERAKRAVA